MDINFLLVILIFVMILLFIMTIITLNVALKLIEDKYLKEKTENEKNKIEIENLKEEFLYLRDFYEKTNKNKNKKTDEKSIKKNKEKLDELQKKYSSTLRKGK